MTGNNRKIFTSGTPTAATPTFSPGAGSYGSTQSVTISTISSGAVICYNTTGSPATNGTTGCTTGTLYTGAVSVSTSETLYAVAGGTGYIDSSVGSAAYAIGGGPTVVQSWVNTAVMNFGSGTVTLSPAATAGHVLQAYCYQGAATNTWSAVDNNSNALTLASPSPSLTLTSGGGTGTSMYVFSYIVPVGGATGLTFTFTGSYGECVVVDVSGLTSSTLKANSADAWTAAVDNPLPSASPTASPSLSCGAFVLLGYSSGITSGAGWTQAGTVSTNGNQLFVECKSTTGTSPISAPITNTTAAPDAFIFIWQ